MELKLYWNTGWYYYPEMGRFERAPPPKEQIRLLSVGPWGQMLPRRLRGKPLSRRKIRRIKENNGPQRDVRKSRQSAMIRELVEAIIHLNNGREDKARVRMRIAALTANRILGRRPQEGGCGRQR